MKQGRSGTLHSLASRFDDSHSLGMSICQRLFPCSYCYSDPKYSLQNILWVILRCAVLNVYTGHKFWSSCDTYIAVREQINKPLRSLTETYSHATRSLSAEQGCPKIVLPTYGATSVGGLSRHYMVYNFAASDNNMIHDIARKRVP
jgi:hypothetical protein